MYSKLTSTSNRRLVLFLFLASLATLARILPQPRTVDDAFITFRYSRNLVEGHGFVYNIGSRVLGTTTPLYTFSMAALGAIFGDAYPWYALILNAAADALSVVLLAWLGYHLTQSWGVGLLVGSLWAIAPYSVTFAIGGMETSLHNLWMLAAWAAYLADKRGGWVGGFVALGLLTRPDALIWATPLMAHQLWTMWRNRLGLPWRDYLAGLIIGLPWTIFATLYFGSPFPHTVGTKSVVYQMHPSQAIVRLIQHYATPFHQEQWLGIMVGIGGGLVLFLTLALIGLRETTKHHPRTLPMFIYPWLYFGVFASLNPLIFRWYLTPPLPAYFLAIVCGGYAFLNALPLSPPRRVWVGWILGLICIGSLLLSWELHPAHGPDRPAPKMAFHELELNYAQMARRLVQEQGVGPNTVIAAGDIGAIGFYTNTTILDTIGLVTKGLNRYYDTRQQKELIVDGANYAIPPAMIFDYEPDFLVVMLDFVQLGLQQDPRFIEQYELLYRIETDYYGGQMLVYRRR